MDTSLKAIAAAPDANPGSRWIAVKIIAAALAVIVTISMAAQWYGRSVGLPRYCADPEAALTDLQRVLDEPRPAGDGPRLRYIVAAKLLFLDPRQDGESEADYIFRLRHDIAEICG